MRDDGRAVAGRVRGLDLEPVARAWQSALDAAQRSLAAAQGELPADELQRRTTSLAVERTEATAGLERLARAASVRPAPWLSPIPLRHALLGLDEGAEACVLDLERVLTDAGAVHAWAWGETFDEFLRRFAERAGRVAVPFDRDAEYHRLVEGRPRLDGVRAFLFSRGIRLPLGETDDPSGISTVHALARRKSELLTGRLALEGVDALPGARRYLDAAGRLGVGRAVLSASVRTAEMLEHSGLASLVDVIVDADRIRGEGLRLRPAPDAVLSACRRLGVAPAAAVAFSGSPLGVLAGRAAGATVVGVSVEPDEVSALLGAGAVRVVPSLSALLDPRLRAGL